MKLSLALLVAALSAVSAMEWEITQTTWEDGPGEPGPVPGWEDWGSAFDSCSACRWHVPGMLTLSSTYRSSPELVTVSQDDGAYLSEVADIDDDGDSDVVLASHAGEGCLLLLRSDGSGTGWTEEVIASPFGWVSSMEACDLDLDGYPDLVCALQSADEVVRLRNPGDADAWEASRVTDLESPRAVRCGDVDGDGLPDIVAGGDSSSVLLCLGDGAGSWSCTPLPSGMRSCTSVDIADLDDDGDTDVLAAAYYDYDILWWESGSGTWDLHYLERELYHASSVAAGDLDGDGDLDVAGAGRDPGYLGWWENEGGSSDWTAHGIDDAVQRPDALVLGDADSDGDLDVLGCDMRAQGGFAAVWESPGGEGDWTRHPYLPGIWSSGCCLLTDIDGDRSPDLTFCRSGSQADSVVWADHLRHAPLGWLDSSVLELNIPTSRYDLVDWGELRWVCDEPAGCSVMFQVRAGQDPEYMGEWSGYLSSSPADLDGVLPTNAWLVQYRVTLMSTAPDSTPLLEEVTLTYQTFGGVAGESAAPLSGPVAELATPCPCSGPPALRLLLDEPSEVLLTAYDGSGRSVIEPMRQALPAGTHLVELPSLPPGLYLLRASAGGRTAVLRAVITE